MNAALGGRVRSDIIGRYGDSAYVELVFSIDDDERRQALADLEVSTEYDCIIISRKIMEGRSVHRINDDTVTSAKIRQVTELLIDLHGQHEHQSLLKTKKHLEIIDDFAAHEADVQKAVVAERYARWQAARKALAAYDMDPETRAREMDFLKYEISELESAGLREGEEEELEAKYKRYRSSGRLAEDISQVLSELDGTDGVSESVSRAVRYLNDAAATDEELGSAAEQLAAIDDLTSGLIRDLNDYAAGLAYDPAQLRQTENRLDELHHLEQKYGAGYEQMMAALGSRRQKLAALEDYEGSRAAAEKDLAAAEAELSDACAVLSRIRRRAAEPLKEAITEALKDLNFLGVEFDIHFEETEGYTANGTDSAQFLISMNPGEEVRPLVQVASGGELSRIMLAIKAVLADKDQIPTLIFDEIDTGISGRTAQKVAEKLAEIAVYRQVICITHLPQIAAMADRHFAIEKSSAEGRTVTSVETLDEAAAVEELARLLSGNETTDTVIGLAREMKAGAKAYKAVIG